MAMYRFHSIGEIEARRLTGRVRHRAGWRGRLVLQVEIVSPKPWYPRVPRLGGYDPWKGGAYPFWRDASAEDLASIHISGSPRTGGG